MSRSSADFRSGREFRNFQSLSVQRNPRKRKRNNFVDALEQLMHGFGDAKDPDPDTVDAVQEIVLTVISEIAMKAEKHRMEQPVESGRKDAARRILLEDIEHALQDYPELLTAARIPTKGKGKS